MLLSAEPEEEAVHGPECLWRDGEHEPEEDPEEWVDRAADEAEEKRLQKMQALEIPEGSAPNWHVSLPKSKRMI